MGGRNPPCSCKDLPVPIKGRERRRSRLLCSRGMVVIFCFPPGVLPGHKGSGGVWGVPGEGCRLVHRSPPHGFLKLSLFNIHFFLAVWGLPSNLKTPPNPDPLWSGSTPGGRISPPFPSRGMIWRIMSLPQLLLYNKNNCFSQFRA